VYQYPTQGPKRKRKKRPPRARRLVTLQLGDRLLGVKHAQQSDLPFSDRHDVVMVVCLWRNGTCHRIEVVRRVVKPGEHERYAAFYLAGE
jgi:hypothetical protein